MLPPATDLFRKLREFKALHGESLQKGKAVPTQPAPTQPAPPAPPAALEQPPPATPGPLRSGVPPKVLEFQRLHKEAEQLHKTKVAGRVAVLRGSAGALPGDLGSAIRRLAAQLHAVEAMA